MSKNLKKSNTRWPLVVYDVIVYIIASILLLWIYGGNENLTNAGSLQLSILGFVCIFICRMIGNIYGQIWRYGGNVIGLVMNKVDMSDEKRYGYGYGYGYGGENDGKKK